MNFFKRKKTIKSLTNILSSFTEVVNQLQELEQHNTAKVSSNEETIKQIQSENAALTTEATQAQAVRNRISELIK